jgi:muconolactone delta-isomerase
MRYLVQMKIADTARPTTPQEGVSFIEQFVLPTLAACKRLEAENKILAGGPVGGAIAIALIVAAETIQELDEILEGLPLWPRMETTVAPLTTFDGRMAAVRSTLERLKERSRQQAT